MPSPVIRITGIDSTLRRVTSVSEQVTPALMKGAVYLRGVLSTYPPRRHITRKSVYGRAFKTIRQQRFFFAALADGRIRVPYVRTRTLGHKWAVKEQSPTHVRVGNNTPYGRIVMDEDLPQSKFMHALGWRTVQTIARVERANVIRIVAEDIKARIAQIKR
jgi:hypothetical protein